MEWGVNIKQVTWQSFSSLKEDVSNTVKESPPPQKKNKQVKINV